ncbi:MAG TPA: hypothetical protein VHQ41_03800 [Patescibacteria group bacterium]|jgi:hypothetical protein|nr:hypothetical protein [Patescibacteria group bacterium]
MEQLSDYIKNTWLGEECNVIFGSHCEECDEYGFCDFCGTFEGRNMEAISDYASTCDGCYDHTAHQLMSMDPQTQLGYCAHCLEKIDSETRERIEAFIAAGEPDWMINSEPLLTC